MPVSVNNEPKKPKGNPDDKDIQWHPAFFEAIRLELEDYESDLEFVAERQLTTKPLQIDVVIVKKTRDMPIKKNIAEIFRRDNIIEYKSPTDYVSIENFYRVYAYACLYAFLEEGADITDMTLTFVASSHPRELLAHLREARGCTVEEKWPGVYIVSGDPLPIQIIDNRKLSDGENLWLKGLDNTLDAQGWLRVTSEILRQGKPSRMGAYFEAIMRANMESFREAYEMNDNTLALDRMFEEIGLTARWEAKGEARGETKILGLFRQGYTVEEVEKMLAQNKVGSTEIPLNGPR